MGFREIIEIIGRAVEAAGVAVLVTGAIASTWTFLRRLRAAGAYEAYRRGLGRSLLLGLELLVAADIIGTVTIRPSLDSVLVLAILVLIRTFLSFSIETELEGRFPWQGKSASGGAPPKEA